MSKQSVTKGATSQVHYVWIRDSSSTVGAGLTGLVFNSGSLVASYVRPAGSRTAITLATQTVTGAYSSGGFVEVDATNMPGLYRLDVPDAVFASGVDSAIVLLKGATNMEPCVIEYELKAVNLQDGVRAGLTALPNAAAEAAGGLYTRGTGAGQINQPANGRVDANAVTMAGTTLTGRDIGASVLLSAGTGTGQLDFTSGVVKANLVQILATALTETAGQIAAAFKKWFDVAAPVGTVNSIPNATAGAAGGLMIAGSNAATTVNITGNLTGNVTGSVGSVTGAVGSVTGAVGSVTGAVGSVTGNVGGNVTGSVGSVASGGITEASYATTAGTFYPLGIIDQGTAQSATGTTLVLRAAAAFASSELVGAMIVITGGSAGVGQSRWITAYNGGTDTATVDTWTTTPTGTITYKIVAAAPAPATPPAVNVTQVIGDPIITSSSKTTNWGGT